MSCKNFEAVITELARGQMTEAGARASALAHMESCKPCAVRHADEQALTAGLRAAAANIATAEASARLEEALVSAFRQRTATPLSPTAQTAYRTLSGWATLAVAAAAAFLVVSAFGISRLIFNGSADSSPRQEARINQPAPASSTATVPQNPAPTSTETESMTAVDDSEQPLAVTQPPRFAEKPHAQSFNTVLNNKSRRGSKGYPLAANEREEIATDFLPLTYGGLSQMDGGQVIRVEVPRSALQSFGLPMNAERAGERVKADVLVGNDGVARAIRFVR
ncbi:MAG: hypothetical protein M3362_28225 [Acidobacteriota bacterium]|nr:hypothetical protein [Acidobacteriota bacterium]